MLFVKTFKGYEDKTAQLDAAVNEWIKAKARTQRMALDLRSLAEVSTISWVEQKGNILGLEA